MFLAALADITLGTVLAASDSIVVAEEGHIIEDSGSATVAAIGLSAGDDDDPIQFACANGPSPSGSYIVSRSMATRMTPPIS